MPKNMACQQRKQVEFSDIRFLRGNIKSRDDIIVIHEENPFVGKRDIKKDGISELLISYYDDYTKSNHTLYFNQFDNELNK